MIPVMKPKIADIDLVYKYLKTMDENNRYSNFGPLYFRAVERVAAFLNSSPENFVLCSNATQALTSAIAVSNRNNLIVPDYTFQATPQSVIASNNHMLLRDVSLTSFQMHIDKLDSNQTPLVVLPFGSKKHIDYTSNASFTIYDAAAAIGSRLNLNLFPKNSCLIFSLQATKVLGIGEGAIFFSRDLNLIQEFKKYINFGFDGTRVSARTGINGKFSEIDASYLLASLDEWEIEESEWMNVNSKIMKMEEDYNLKNVNINDNEITPYWILETNVDVEIARQRFLELGIETRSWYSACHTNEAFAKYSCPSETYCNSTYLKNHHIGLPKFRKMSLTNFDHLNFAIEKLVSNQILKTK